VGSRAGLDRCGKSRLPPGFDPRTVQPVASRYTDYATRPTLITVLDDNIQPRRLLPENQSVMSLCRPLCLFAVMNRKLALFRMVALMRIELLMSKPLEYFDEA